MFCKSPIRLKLERLNSKIPMCSVIPYGTTIQHNFCQQKFMILFPNTSTDGMHVHER